MRLFVLVLTTVAIANVALAADLWLDFGSPLRDDYGDGRDLD